jgi:hypothetical protein
MKKAYDVMDMNKDRYSTFQTPTRHKIDQHNNLHLMDDSYEDIMVIKSDQWAWFRINRYDE